jgi:hypothetical protein
MMLPPCTECHRPQEARRSETIPAGHVRHHAFGRCHTCYMRQHRSAAAPRVYRSTRPPFHAVSVDYRLSNGQVITLPSKQVVLRMSCSPDDGIVDPIAVWRGWKDWTAPRLSSREILCVVAELATRDWAYPEIGDRLGVTGDGVRKLVMRFGLPQPPPRKYGSEYLCQLILESGKRQTASSEALRLAGVRTA